MAGLLDPARIRRIRNFQSQEWYAAFVMRPLCILVMIPIADLPWITPNRLTHCANLSKLAAAWFIVQGGPGAHVAAALLLQLGLLFDHLDGTLARYRRAFTSFGSLYDKVSDAVTWQAVVAALGWAAVRQTGKAWLGLLAVQSSYALLAMGYSKWVLHAEEEKKRWLEARRDPAAAVAARTAPPRISEPPERTAGDWLRWALARALTVVRFEEVDLFFWVGLGLVLGELEILLWGMALTQTAGMLGVLAWRARKAAALDAELRALRAEETA